MTTIQPLAAIAPLIAQVCHEANRAYCLTLGDKSQLPWDEAPEWARESAIKGVEFHLANPDAGPEASHESWLAEKERTGWVWGPEKIPELLEHPCMVPFAQLSVDQQRKDFIFRAIVHAYLCSHPGATVRNDEQGIGATIFVDRWAFFGGSDEEFAHNLDSALENLRERLLHERRAGPEVPA